MTFIVALSCGAFDEVLALLDGKRQPALSLLTVLESSFEQLKQGERLSSSYFDVLYYRQVGTIHFYPRSKELMDRLNRWGGHHRRWMPPPEAAASTFSKQYELAEALDRDVRARSNGNEVPGPGTGLAGMVQWAMYPTTKNAESRRASALDARADEHDGVQPGNNEMCRSDCAG